jgi:cytosine/adenosine deaminase-related metal-dependent hydrolase
MIARRAADAMGIPGHRLRAGAPANLVVLQGESVLEALRDHVAPAFVISHGKLVDADMLRAGGF